MLAENLSSGLDRFRSLHQIILSGPEGRHRNSVLEHAWEHGGQLVLKFEGLDDRTAVEPFAGWEVCVPFEQRAPIPESEYYISDLIGCEVVTTDGRVIGTVTGWQEHGAAGLLEIGHILIPFAKAICREIRPEERRIVVDPPEGLLELNRG